MVWPRVIQTSVLPFCSTTWTIFNSCLIWLPKHILKHLYTCPQSLIRNCLITVPRTPVPQVLPVSRGLLSFCLLQDFIFTIPLIYTVMSMAGIVMQRIKPLLAMPTFHIRVQLLKPQLLCFPSGFLLLLPGKASKAEALGPLPVI